eukprot:gnl/TRDRNA2_/TRDRNA2_44736_c0_seq1.p1 gnl/TRDRNA2_/TRDRNA2_44736_c0~~gnl/TRDRNA2_/TRDRNA2_44736_c0_seq1.p1  ORF type:complete len:320 (-),score=42.87 gnl/TRDRNA2_/TRDRNA2_44736_c0_seq1:146-1105(-)
MHVILLLVFSNIAVSATDGTTFEGTSGCETNAYVIPEGQAHGQHAPNDFDLVVFLRVERGEADGAAVKPDASAASTEGEDPAAFTKGEDPAAVTEDDTSGAEDDSQGGGDDAEGEEGDDADEEGGGEGTTGTCCCRDVGHSVACNEETGEKQHIFPVLKSDDVQKGAPHACCKFESGICTDDHPIPASNFANGGPSWCQGGSVNHDPRVTRALGSLSSGMMAESKMLSNLTLALDHVIEHHANHGGEIKNTFAVHERVRNGDARRNINKERAKLGQKLLTGDGKIGHHDGHPYGGVIGWAQKIIAALNSVLPNGRPKSR